MSAPTLSSEGMPPGIPRGALTPRLISFFSGTVGFSVKIALLSFSNALAVWAGYVLAERSQWIGLIVLVLVTAAIDALYLGGRRFLPLKFLIPATIFMVAFQIVPILYTIDVSFTNYSTGHIASKGDAIRQIQL